jgi:glycosyltransferase involved in cell wall biosynthesis
MKIVMICRKGKIGGVTSSVGNLVSNLRSDGHKVIWPKFLVPYFYCDIVHLHFSNPKIVAIFAKFFRLFGRRIIWTVHHSRLDATLVRSHKKALAVVDGVIFLNEGIHQKNASCLSPDVKVEILTPVVGKQIQDVSRVRSLKDYVSLLLYASKRSYDLGEVYGIEWTLGNLEFYPDNWNFTVVDPSGEYRDYIPKTSRVTYIRRADNFCETLAVHDVYLRPTSTDGQSVAILESLGVGTPVVASNVVPRPQGVFLYQHLSLDDYCRAISEAINSQSSPNSLELSSVKDYQYFFEKCLMPAKTEP